MLLPSANSGGFGYVIDILFVTLMMVSYACTFLFYAYALVLINESELRKGRRVVGLDSELC